MSVARGQHLEEPQMQSQCTASPASRAWLCIGCHHQIGSYDGEWVAIWAPRPLIYNGKVVVECPRCKATTVWHSDDPEASLALTVSLGQQATTDDLLAAMEQRWAQFRLSKLRERGAVAVGLRFDVFMRDDFRCRYCGISVNDGAILHADHVIAESKGGPTTLENLVTACIDCNLGKSDKDLPA